MADAHDRGRSPTSRRQRQACRSDRARRRHEVIVITREARLPSRRTPTPRFWPRRGIHGRIDVCALTRLCLRGVHRVTLHRRPRAHDTSFSFHLAVDLWRSQRATIMQILDSVDAASLRSRHPRLRAPATPSRCTSTSSKARARVSRSSRASSSAARATACARPSRSARSASRSASSAPSRCTRPVIDHIEVVTRGDVRRAKLYYLREPPRQEGQDQGEARPLSRSPRMPRASRGASSSRRASPDAHVRRSSGRSVRPLMSGSPIRGEPGEGSHDDRADRPRGADPRRGVRASDATRSAALLLFLRDVLVIVLIAVWSSRSSSRRS